MPLKMLYHIHRQGYKLINLLQSNTTALDELIGPKEGIQFGNENSGDKQAGIAEYYLECDHHRRKNGIEHSSMGYSCSNCRLLVKIGVLTKME